LFSSDKGIPHEYILVLEEQRKVNQERSADHLKHIPTDVQPYSLERFRKGSDVLINANLQVDGFEAECGVLTKIEGKSRFGKFSYEPSIFAGTYSLNKEQKLEVSYVAFVLKTLQHTSPSTGKIIGMGGTPHTVKLDQHFKDLRSLHEPLRKWTRIRPATPPPIVLNKHCPLCPFQRPCLAQAEQDDNLSLLDGVTARVVRKYENKGIFTVKQLSYLFKPRKRKKDDRKPSQVRHQFELQALAIREKKIYLQETPALDREPIELFLDIEGIPDRGFYYLMGLLVCRPDAAEHHVFWADSDPDEGYMWRQFMDMVTKYHDGKIYHYGSYEAQAVAQLAKRHGTDAESVTKRLVNVNRYVYGKVYFPVRSNGLKDIGHFIGAHWTSPVASGLQSLVWRHHWEETREDAYKNTLITYNSEDCQALQLLLSYLTNLQESVKKLTNVCFADRPQKHATERGEGIHRVFDVILKSAHGEYTRKRVLLRSYKDHGNEEPKKRGAPKGHQAYQRLPARTGKVKRVYPRRTCPTHKGEPLKLGEQMAEHSFIDLNFTAHGCRKSIIKYMGKRGYCSKCDKYYDPRRIEQFGGQVFGHAFQSWTIYQRMILRLPYRIIIDVMEEMFGERASTTTILKFIKRFAEYYAPAEHLLLQRLLHSPFLHVDETKISIRGIDHYVWAFTDGTHVVFKLTATRETTVVHETLAEYAGVLVSDFYPGYDSVPCRQQKCLVHLIRDLNDDLWNNAFDRELESFVYEVKNLLVPIFEAVEKYGLKRRHLHKFFPSVERFYRQHILETMYISDATIKFQKRFQRYRDTLFTFLHEDGIPWQNNMAERALRHIAVQRKISGSFFEQSAQHFLLLLGLSQSCQFQGKSFLKFLLSKTYDIDAFKSPRRVQNSRAVSKGDRGLDR
jgi:predicted RecB family nuclease